ncbi:MAG: hypothetical protein K2L42_02550 [Clostridia bacterium]|nr:hypothetical protein [Clostridia bacterium]
MIEFLFADGEEICSYADGEIKRHRSKFIEKYRQTALDNERAKSWKHSGEGAQFRGDVRYTDSEVNFQSTVNGVYPLSDNAAAYSFTINGTSGIYKAVIGEEKAQETHIINSVDYDFSGGCADVNSNTLFCSLRRNAFNSDIAVFDLNSGDYKTVTDGDTLDCDPFVSPQNGNVIYFTSRGAGRDGAGTFIKYSNAAICKLNLSELTVEEVAVSDKLNYMKPIEFGGKLYAIAAPSKERRPNPIIEILLIPFRIIQALANFINVFVKAFTGKSLASGGDNPAKGREYDSRKEYVKGNLINFEKELKKNKSKKDKDYGFIPQSWKLIEVNSGQVIKSGAADFDITPDGTFIVTNGRRIFAVKDGKSTKLCNTERCLAVACVHGSQTKTDIFDF